MTESTRGRESLFDKIAARRSGICLYGFAPPKRSSTPDELGAIAAQQVQRLRGLALDGVIVYDIQDEAERVADPRPFPFLPTVAPDEYAAVHLRELELPKIVYRSVGNDSGESFTRWLSSRTGPALSVLVGAPSRHAQSGLPLRDAYALAAQHAPGLTLGGIAIAERHERKLDEHERILSKTAAGCRFFVTQAVYDVSSSLSLLSDYALALERSGAAPAPVILTFSPCGSPRTLEFMKWLGIRFPRWLENELKHASDPLATSLALCERIFLEIWSYAKDKGIPLGVNVESVSIRKAEIEASLALARSLVQHLGGDAR
jgi:hypothetical protein